MHGNPGYSARGTLTPTDLRSTIHPKLPKTVSRRAFVRAGVGAVLGSSLGGCDLNLSGSNDLVDPHLTARPGPPTVDPTLGASALGLARGRDGFLYVPTTYEAARPLPLVVALHGATVDSEYWAPWLDIAEAEEFVLLAIDSRGTTWDLVGRGFGPDVTFLDAALRHTFERCAIDTGRISLVGHSDGAGYALSLGVLNGDLFTHLVAFAAGFLEPRGRAVGMPLIWMAHGTFDPRLSINTAHHIAAVLEDTGYHVTFVEFDGTHVIPAEVARAGVDWLLTAGP